MQRGLDLDDARLTGTAPLNVLLDDVDALDHHSLTIDEILANPTSLTFVATSGDQNFVAAPNLLHRPSHAFPY
jgi:hypothetical protein